MNVKVKFLPAMLLAWGSMMVSSQALAAKIYTCEVDGQTIYTSRPSANCHSADLPSIGRYSSSRYDEPQMTISNDEAVAPTASKHIAKKANSAKKHQPKASANNTVQPKVATPRPAAPVVAAPVQKTPANNSRRAILQQELANERKALSDAQKSLAQARTAKGGSVDPHQVSQLQSSVLDRQQNIQALQRELGRM